MKTSLSHYLVVLLVLQAFAYTRVYGQVALIFKDLPRHTRSFFPFSGIYIDDHRIQRPFTVDDDSADTVILNTNRKYIAVDLYKSIDRLEYLFKNGDTVLFQYRGQVPSVSIINRRDATFEENNFGMIRRGVLSPDTLPADLMLKNFMYFLRFQKSDPAKASSELFRILKPKAASELSAEMLLLDSLRAHGKMRSDFYAYYAAINRTARLRASEDSSNLYLINQKLDAALYRRVRLSAKLQHDDSLMYYPFYHDLCGWLYRIEGRRVKRYITSNGNVPDFHVLYDSLNEMQFYPEWMKKTLLLKAVEDRISISSAGERRAVRVRFVADVNDPAFASHITEKYKLDGEITTRLELLSVDRIKTSLEKVISENKGFVVYVDIWASWCAPCIRAFPESRKMVEEFKDENVHFVYLSKDEVYKRWVSASDRHGLSGHPGNFIIDNQFTSKFLEDLRVTGIPRYLLYDADGNLVHQHAPGPGTEARNLIRSYIKQ